MNALLCAPAEAPRGLDPSRLGACDNETPIERPATPPRECQSITLDQMPMMEKPANPTQCLLPPFKEEEPQQQQQHRQLFISNDIVWKPFFGTILWDLLLDQPDPTLHPTFFLFWDLLCDLLL